MLKGLWDKVVGIEQFDWEKLNLEKNLSSLPELPTRALGPMIHGLYVLVPIKNWRFILFKTLNAPFPLELINIFIIVTGL